MAKQCLNSTTVFLERSQPTPWIRRFSRRTPAIRRSCTTISIFSSSRKIEKEINPDLEIVRFLSENTSFRNSPKYSGSVEYKDEDGKQIVFGLSRKSGQSGRCGMTIDSIWPFYERVMAAAQRRRTPQLLNKPAVLLKNSLNCCRNLLGEGFYEKCRQMIQHERTWPGHTDTSDNLAFFRVFYQQCSTVSLFILAPSWYDRFKLCDSHEIECWCELAERVLGMEEGILECFSEIYEVRING